MRQDYLINTIKNKQQADGSWVDASNLGAVFLTALILSSLNRAKILELEDARRRAVEFLLSKKNKDWQFSSNLFINFTVIVALAEYDLEIFDGEALAKILKILTELEQQLGGPYFDNYQKTEIDFAFNCQVARFLDLYAVELPNLTSYFQNHIEKNDFYSRYFNSAFPGLYFLSCFYRGDNCEQISRYLIDSGVFNLNKLMDYLFALNVRKNWVEVFEYDEENTPPWLAWSREEMADYILIPVLILEAFPEPNPACIEKNKNEQEEVIFEIKKTAEEKFANLSVDMRTIAEAEIARTMAKNQDGQMSLLPYFVRKALGERGKIFSDDFIVKAGLANIFFWNAFIIYDDFWDEEGEPCRLPTANCFARYYIDFYENIFPGDKNFQQYFHGLMDKLDQANTWETKHCRAKIEFDKLIIPADLPDYGDYELAFAPASAHILGAVAILYRLGYDLDSLEIKNLENYFRHYLIAMQINDDALDWEEDLERGHLSTVVMMIIRKYLQKFPEAEFIDLSSTNREELKKFYWYEIVRPMCHEVLAQTEQARVALEKLTMFEDLAPLAKLIEVTEAVAVNTLQDFKKKADFLENFSLE